MNLLNTKQIAELVTIASNQSTSKDLHDEFEEWNKKQQSFIEPNWNRLPSKIKYCHLRHYYFDDIGNEIDWEFIINFERPTIPHPHAALMAKYAEVAARRVDPWVEFQVYSYPFSCWVTLETPTFFDSAQRYRHIGDDK
jgi:hypothetical protein